MPLRKTDVVDEALRLLDAEGLDQLTMRRLGAALGVQGGALYRHYPNKDALLDAMADKLVEGFAAPLPDAPWPDQVRTLSHRLRTALLSHRDGARVVAGTFGPGPNTVRATDAAVRVLCAAGFPPAQAGWITFAVFYYVLGHTIEEQAQLRLPSDHDWRDRAARLQVPVSPEYEAAVGSLATADPADRFHYGLDAFVEGLRHLRPGPSQPG